MTRWLTVSDVSIELGIDSQAVWRLWKKGQLKGVGDNIHNLRILDPGPFFADQLFNRNLDHFPFITTRELAEVLGISYVGLRVRMSREKANKNRLKPSGELHCHFKDGSLRKARGGRRKNEDPTRFFNRLEVRRYLARFEKGRSKQDRFTYSHIIVKWLRGWIATQQTQVAVVDELMQHVLNIPEPDRSRIAAQLWNHFDQVNALLRECAEKTKREP